MKSFQFSKLASVAFTFIAAFTAMGATAQIQSRFPGKPVDITVPYPPGGGVDLLARLIGQSLSSASGQSVIVENRAGAGSTIGTRYVAGRPKDGHSLLMMNDAYAIAPGVFKSLPYDPKKDLEAVINVAYAPMLLVASEGSPYKTVADVVKAAQMKDAKLSYASCGTGTDPHLAGELFNITFKTRLAHIPYKGCGPAIVDVLGGQVELGFVTITGAIPYVKSGKMRALAITAKERSQIFPDVPTLAQSGAPNFYLSQWQGLAVPAGTPANVKNAIYEAVSKVMQTPATQSKLQELGYMPANDGPEVFQKIVNSDIDRFSKLAKQIGLTLD
ncbi:MAG: tripartite tricarboxylate transporter substrate binding protein [Pseudomonadota bacterium]